MTPQILFHGTPLGGLRELHPAPGGILYASSDMRLSSTFLADPEHCVCVRSAHGDVHALIGERREDFVRRDRGGTIYLVEATRFAPSPAGVHLARVWEWTTSDPVTPIGSITYTSALTAMIALGVRVYFVAETVCAAVRAADDALLLTRSLRCENAAFERYLQGPDVWHAPDARGVRHEATVD